MPDRGYQSGGSGFLSVGPSMMFAALALNTANIVVACYFTALETSITGFKFATGSNVGTAGNIKATFNVYAVGSNGWATGSSLGSVTVTGPTANAWNTASLSISGLTVGTKYIVLATNTATAPATDYYRISTTNSSTSAPIFGYGPKHRGISRCLHSTDAGSTWNALESAAIFPVYTTAGAAGPLVAAPSTTNIPIYSSRMLALLVNFPYRTYLHEFWTGIQAANTGSPSGNLKGICWNGGGSVADSANVSPMGASLAHQFYWDSPQVLNASTDYYIGVAIGSGATTDASNRPNWQPNTAMSTTPLFDNPLKGCYLYDGSSWSASNPIMCGLTVEIAPASSGGLLVNPGFNGGFN